VNLLKPRSETRRVRSEVDGGLAGRHTEHWDDHVDAYVSAGRARVHIPEHGLLFPGRGLLLPAPERRPRLIGHRRDGSRIGEIAGGAFGSSGLYVANIVDVFDATQLAIDTSLTTHRWAMYTNTLTPNFDTDAAYSATNEVTGTGYTAGGQTIVSPTTTGATGTLTYDMADQVWASPTTVTARGAILYADALAGNNLIVAMTFGADFTSTAGTFTIQFAAGGVFTIDLTP
jgi:hypothetical protein